VHRGGVDADADDADDFGDIDYDDGDDNDIDDYYYYYYYEYYNEDCDDNNFGSFERVKPNSSIWRVFCPSRSNIEYWYSWYSSGQDIPKTSFTSSWCEKVEARLRPLPFFAVGPADAVQRWPFLQSRRVAPKRTFS